MRKTNLFYSQNQDSNFITFSNYTEALTGNILSTNSKMFPSKFICLYIPSLDDENNFDTEKNRLITQYLSGYYENKLAVIRDWCLKTNYVKPENILNPLDSLLEAIFMFDSNTEITFIGDICEQDYNGTFMDNICIIENNASSQLYEYVSRPLSNNYIDLESDNFLSEKYKSYDDYQHKLYGWAGAKMPSNFNNVVPLYDFNGETNDPHYYYYYESESYIKFKYVHNNETDEDELAPKPSSIRFNILIPLFDVYQYYQSQTLNVLSEFKYDDKDQQGLDESIGKNLVLVNNSEYKNQYDVPIGMWFSDKTIELDRSTVSEGQNKLYRPSWSLCISAQFKPFPYSNSYPNEINDYDNPDKFASFAMIMSKQAFIVDEFNTLSENYATLANQLNDLAITVRTLQGIEENQSGDESTNISVDSLQNQLNVIQNNLLVQQAQLNLFSNNYIKDAELEEKAERLGYLTAEGVVQFIGTNYLTKSQFDNYLNQYSYATNTDLNKIINISHNTFRTNLNNYISDPNNSPHSTLAQRVYRICGQNDWASVFTDETSMIVQNGKTIPAIYSYCHNDLVTGYQSAYAYLLGRIEMIDGIGLAEHHQQGTTGSKSVVETLTDTFDSIENIHFPAIKNLFAYLLLKTTLFGGVKYNVQSGNVSSNSTNGNIYGTIDQTNESEYTSAINSILTGNWTEIYAGNNVSSGNNGNGGEGNGGNE